MLLGASWVRSQTVTILHRFAEDLYILTRTGQKRDYNLYFGQIAKSLTFIVSNLERLNITAVQLSAIDGATFQF